MLHTIIAKNTAGIDLLIDDMGIVLTSGSSRILSDNFTETDICNSTYLYDFINTGKIILNNGSRDLSLSESIELINLLSELESKSSLISGGTEIQQFVFLNHNNTSYVSWSETTYTSLCKFVFKGAYNGIVPKFNFISYCSSGTNSSRPCYVQLFDITNNRQVFEKTTWGTAAKIDSVLNVSGITTSEAIFEIKLKCFNAADTINIHSFSIVYA